MMSEQRNSEFGKSTHDPNEANPEPVKKGITRESAQKPVHNARLPRVYHPGPPYKCPQCGREFLQSGNLTKHLRSHQMEHLRWNRNTSEKPFKCSFAGCHKSFTAKSTLQNHMKVHSATDSHGGESASAATKSAVQSTAQINRSMVYSCLHPGCTQCFASFTDLRKHVTQMAPGLQAERNVLVRTLLDLVNFTERVAMVDVNFGIKLRSTIDTKTIREAMLVLAEVDEAVGSSSPDILAISSSSSTPSTEGITPRSGWDSHIINHSATINTRGDAKHARALQIKQPDNERMCMANFDAGRNQVEPDLARATAMFSREQIEEDLILRGQVGFME